METCYKLVDRTLLDRARAAVRPLRHRARDHREDPEAADPHLRGADLVHRARVRRRQEDHVARRLRGVVDAGQVPLRRLSREPDARRAGRPSSSTTRPGRCSRRACARCSPTRARARSSSSSSTTARATDRSTRCSPRIPTCASSRAPGNVGYARAANLGIAATQGADRRGAESRHRARAGRRRRDARPARATSRASARAARACATSTAPTTRRPASIPSVAGRGRARAARAVVAEEPVHARGTASSTPIPTVAAPRRLGLGRGDLAAARRARRGRRLGRALLHVPGGHRPVLAAAARGLGGRVRAVGRGRARAGREHVAPAVPDAARAPSVGVALRRRSGSPAPRVVLLPFAAVYFALRAGAWRWREHAWRSSGAAAVAPMRS